VSVPHTEHANSDLPLSDEEVDVVNIGSNGAPTCCISDADGVPNSGAPRFTGSCSVGGFQLVLGLAATGGVQITALTSAPGPASDVMLVYLACLWASDVTVDVPTVAVAVLLTAATFWRTRVDGDPGSNGTAPPSGTLPSGFKTYPRPWPFSSKCRFSALLNLDEKRQTEQRNRWTLVCDLR